MEYTPAQMSRYLALMNAPDAYTPGTAAHQARAESLHQIQQEQAAALTAIILPVDENCLTYQVEMKPHEARHFAEHCRSGCADGELLGLIDALDAVIPPMQYGPGNPNNGHPFHTYKVGREGSRVLYLDCVKTYLPRYDFSQIAAAAERLAAEFGADEFTGHKDTPTGLVCRFWWD